MLTVDTVGVTYDALGRMVEQNRSGTYTQIVYAPTKQKLALMFGQTLSQALVLLPAGAQAVYNSSGLHYYRHPDWLGSSRFASTPTRTLYTDEAYAPFGENYAATGSTDLHFTGHDADITNGLYDTWFREYHPKQGRWITPDPAGMAAVDPSNPQSWNRYGYVGNNPLALMDPSGLDSIKVPTCRLTLDCEAVVHNYGGGGSGAYGAALGSSLVWVSVSYRDNRPGADGGVYPHDYGYYTTQSFPSGPGGAPGGPGRPGGPITSTKPAANKGSQQEPDPVAVANSMKQYVKAQTSNCYNGFHTTTGGKVVQAFSALALFPVASNYQNNQISLGAEILGKLSMVAGSNSAGGCLQRFWKGLRRT